ncbi:PTS sugar transporter subunit IIC, partial [Staphylococcus hominis]
LFGFNKPLPSVITIIVVAVVSIILAYIFGKLISKLNITKTDITIPGQNNQVKESV